MVVIMGKKEIEIPFNLEGFKCLNYSSDNLVKKRVKMKF